jgi:hypothetical protein
MTTNLSESKDMDLNTKNKLFIEKIIEYKFSQILEQIPELRQVKKNVLDENDFFNFTLIDTYKNTIQTIIDIINDVIKLFDNSYAYNYSNTYMSLLNIFFQENRMFYIGIILVILSFVIYFIDGASI